MRGKRRGEGQIFSARSHRVLNGGEALLLAAPAEEWGLLKLRTKGWERRHPGGRQFHAEGRRNSQQHPGFALPGVTNLTGEPWEHKETSHKWCAGCQEPGSSGSSIYHHVRSSSGHPTHPRRRHLLHSPARSGRRAACRGAERAADSTA